MTATTAAELAARTGEEIAVSRWFAIDQPLIDAFAALTGDRQFIHIDPIEAAKTPFGGTIAHGFLTLSLLSAMACDALPELAGQSMSVNYGFDRIRFLAPVPAGARLRARFTLEAQEAPRPGELTQRWGVRVEIEGADKPALAAQWLHRRYLAHETNAVKQRRKQ